MFHRKNLGILGAGTSEKARALVDRISPGTNSSLVKALKKVSGNSENFKIKEELPEIEEFREENKKEKPEGNTEDRTEENKKEKTEENSKPGSKIGPETDFKTGKLNKLAAGSYTSFFNMETPSGDEFIRLIDWLDRKREEKGASDVTDIRNLSTLPSYQAELKKIVTENRAYELRKALEYIEYRKVLLITGIGGMGKSTLARALTDFRPVGVPEPFYFDFSRNRDAKLGDVLEKLASCLGAPEIADFRKERRAAGEVDVGKLIAELKKRSQSWLLFDGLEFMLEDRRFLEEGMEMFFSALSCSTHNAKILITSRVRPVLKNGESLDEAGEAGENLRLFGLRTGFAVKYLTGKGLSCTEPDILEELAAGVDGHPLALKLLAEFVKKSGDIEAREALSICREREEDAAKKAKKLFDGLAGDEKELLGRISVYRKPADIKALKMMFTEKTPANAVTRLLERSLLETDSCGNYWIQPLIMEFASRGLENKEEAHMLACKYYLSTDLPENPGKKEELSLAIEAHHHACEAGAYDLGAWVIYRSNLYLLLDLWGDSGTLAELYGRLLPEDPFKGEVLLRKEIKGFVFGNSGLTCSRLGYLKKAVEYYEQALKIARETEDWRGEGNRLGNLGNAYLQLGDPEKAIQYYEQILEIHRKIDDRNRESADLGNLGLAYSRLKEPEKAIKYFEQALNIARETGDRRGEGKRLGNLGKAYIQLEDPGKAIDFFKKSLTIGKELNDPGIIRFCEQELKWLEAGS
ncbi:tetratricopeptide repeat protein [Methanosarcina sp. KYL-1]|uniref:tetratricopeptide repeat protein n=1 Tax=Methanosarcina sp. KYL-1 TaxID=2602068 RepID=UPI0021006E1B|nr:tetratricopeptide repeat protein [Methanosarcina sp. KYL-1]MCQ1536315.1 tetratricopeptide repeat protein [Methanosarcina sp. KYL-1]